MKTRQGFDAPYRGTSVRRSRQWSDTRLHHSYLPQGAALLGNAS
ncbi:hypothetical protein [Enteractinococcus helveticum]|nr:hypothetical protein [Enteractinococcus helveticum]